MSNTRQDTTDRIAETIGMWRALARLQEALPAGLPGDWALCYHNRRGIGIKIELGERSDYARWLEVLGEMDFEALGARAFEGPPRVVHTYRHRATGGYLSLFLLLQKSGLPAASPDRTGEGSVWAEFAESLDLGEETL